MPLPLAAAVPDETEERPSDYTPHRVDHRRRPPADAAEAKQRVAYSLSELIKTYIRLIALDNEVRDLLGYIAVADPTQKHICNESREIVVRKFIAEYANYVPELSDLLDRLKENFDLE